MERNSEAASRRRSDSIEIGATQVKQKKKHFSSLHCLQNLAATSLKVQPKPTWQACLYVDCAGLLHLVFVRFRHGSIIKRPGRCVHAAWRKQQHQQGFSPNTVRCSDLILPATVALGEPLLCMVYSVSAAGWAALVIELHSQQSIQFQQALPLPQAPPQYSSDGTLLVWVHAVVKCRMRASLT